MGQSVESIGDTAFGMCTSLKEIHLPNSITSIGAGSFLGCSSLKEVFVPNSVTWTVNTIAEFTFVDCTSLEHIYFEGSEKEWYKSYPNYKTDMANTGINPQIHYNYKG